MKNTNMLYDRIINYRAYCIRRTTLESIGKETSKINYHVKILEVTLRDNKFDGGDSIKVLKFFGAFSCECETIQVYEGK